MAIEQVKLNPEKIEELAELGRNNFFFFARGILGFSDMVSTIHQPIANDLMRYDEIRRFLIILPRTWFKSTLVTIAYSLWRAVRNPNIRILIAQNTYSNAIKKLYGIRQIVETNELFRACYPEILPDRSCKWNDEGLCFKRAQGSPESTIEAAGVGTAVVSRHYDLIIEDDTVAPKKDSLTAAMMQPTRDEIEKAIGWHKLAHPLLVNPARSQIIVVGTRWAERDLLSYIMTEEDYMYHIYQRAIMENDEGEADPLGHLTWPQRFNEETMKELVRAMGRAMFSCLYLNIPVALADQTFRREHILYYNNLKETNIDYVFCTSVDLATSKSQGTSNPDYTIVITTAMNIKNGHIYIVHYDRGQFNPGQTIDAIFKHYRMFHPMKILIEGIGYQRTLQYWLEQKQRKLKEFFEVEVVKSWNLSKEDRIRGLQPYFEANRIFMTTDMDDLERELLAFPKGENDDIIDALSSQLKFWLGANREHVNYQRRAEMKDPHSAYRILKELADKSTIGDRFPNDTGLVAVRNYLASEN